MKLSNAQIEAVTQEIINVKITEINELYEKTVEKAIKKEYEEYLKSDFAKQVEIIIAINSDIVINVNLRDKCFGKEYYDTRMNINKINETIYSNLCNNYKNSLNKDLTTDKVKHLIILNTIDAKDLQELIKIVTSKL